MTQFTLKNLDLTQYYFFSLSAYPELPETFSLERRLAQLDRMKKLDMNPIDGPLARK